MHFEGLGVLLISNHVHNVIENDHLVLLADDDLWVREECHGYDGTLQLCQQFIEVALVVRDLAELFFEVRLEHYQFDDLVVVNFLSNLKKSWFEVSVHTFNVHDVGDNCALAHARNLLNQCLIFNRIVLLTSGILENLLLTLEVVESGL